MYELLLNKTMKKDNPISLAQQQEKELADKFMTEYRALVEKYGFDFHPQTQMVIVKINPDQNAKPTTNLNPLGTQPAPVSEPAK